MIGYATLLAVLGISSIALTYALKTTRGALYTRTQGFLEFFQYAGVASLFLILTKMFLIDLLKVPSGSMLPNYPIGQYIITKPTAFGIRDPWQNDVVYGYKSEQLDLGKVVISRFPYASYVKYLKRIVALPGDRISINKQGIYLNGVFSVFTLVDVQNHIYEISLGESKWKVIIDPKGQFIDQPLITLADDEVFLLGDNLTKSSDSRELGPLKSRHIISSVI